MPNDRPTRAGSHPINEIVDLPATPSFSFAEANCIVDIEVQADQLLAYIDKLTSLADRACNTAIRQSETAQFLEKNRYAEISTLRTQLERQKEQHHEQKLALLRVEHESKSRIASLESQLHQIEIHQKYAEKDKQRDVLQSLQHLAGRTFAPQVATDAQKPDPVLPSPPSSEIAELKRQLAKRDEMIQKKNGALKEMEVEYRGRLTELEKRLAAAESQVALQETKLQEKEAQIIAAGIKEAEVGNLLKRLSAECAALNSQLQEKNQKLIQIERQKIPTTSEATIWRRMIGRLQEEPQ